MREIKTDLSDTKIEAASDFVEKGQTFIYRDFGGPSSVTGLRARVGQHRVTLYFHHDDRTHGQRKITSKRLGHWPATTIKEARGMARIEAGRIAAGNGEPGKRAAVKFEEAFADYVAYLERKADANGKPRRWARNVAQLGRQLLLPQWGGWSLADMSTQPGAIAKWHREATRAAGPVSANHAARVLRAAYRRAARLDLSLSKADFPTAAVEYNRERPKEIGLPFADFPKWLKAWQEIKSPVRRAYHMVAILTGGRAGELSRLRWQDVAPRTRTLTASRAKAGNDIAIPMSAAIARALKLARGADPVLVFPGTAQAGHRDRLPARGNMLRHTYSTVARDCGVDDLLVHFLMGHAPEGISQRYIVRLMLTSGPAMREAQRKISRRMIELLGK